MRLLEETLRIQRKDNELLGGKIDNMTKDNDEELTTLNFEIARLKIQSSSNIFETWEVTLINQITFPFGVLM